MSDHKHLENTYYAQGMCWLLRERYIGKIEDKQDQGFSPKLRSSRGSKLFAQILQGHGIGY